MVRDIAWVLEMVRAPSKFGGRMRVDKCRVSGHRRCVQAVPSGRHRGAQVVWVPREIGQDGQASVRASLGMADTDGAECERWCARSGDAAESCRATCAESDRELHGCAARDIEKASAESDVCGDGGYEHMTDGYGRTSPTTSAVFRDEYGRLTGRFCLVMQAMHHTYIYGLAVRD